LAQALLVPISGQLTSAADTNCHPSAMSFLQALVAGMALGALGIVQGRVSVHTGKVRVKFYGESGCPTCRAFVAGPLNQTLEATGIADIMDFEFSPWGNAYFATAKCGGEGGYSVSARSCFNSECGAEATQRPADCFTSKLVCQHGEVECKANRYLACAKTAGATFQKYMPFVTCLEARYGNFGIDEHAVEAAADSCATLAGLSFAAISDCFTGDAGGEALVAEAQATPTHPGVPYVVLNGKPLVDTDALLRSVCEEYAGHDLPVACGTPPAVLAKRQI